MGRLVFQVLLRLLLPLGAYMLWSTFSRRRQGLSGLPGWEEGNWFWAALAGFVLAGGMLGFLASSGDAPGGIYISPHVVDGKVVPGRFVSDGN